MRGRRSICHEVQHKIVPIGSKLEEEIRIGNGSEMSSPEQSPLRVQLNLTVSPAELLQGIETWLELGLLSDAQVRQLCQQYLSCRLPEPVIQKQPPPPPPPPLVFQGLPPATALKPPLVARMLQSFVEELSIRWLLFLGVFMVVVSSGVLAASQWEQFPAFAQYGVLWGYTIVFAFVSVWAQRQDNLTLTAQTLRTVTLLLVPLNFWAMDSFGLWENPIGLLTISIGTFSLTVLSWWFYREHDPAGDPTDFPTSAKQRFQRYCPLLLWLWLSYLHWGWGWMPFPLIAAYQGTLGATGNIVTTLRQPSRRSHPFHTAISLYALSILLGRAIFFADVPVAQLGLAIGICGWLFTFRIQREEGRGDSTQNSRYSGIRSRWEEQFGVLLMFLGWLVCVETQPDQALAVSGFAATWVGDRLLQQWRKRDLATIYMIGWQSLFLVGRIIPSGIRSSAIATGTQWVQAQGVPGTLLSLTWFPYLLLMLGMNEWLASRQKYRLARFGDKLALGFGVFLTAIGVFNPAIRSLNLLLSTIVLLVVTRRRYPTSVPLAYLTHITGLLAVAAIVNWQFPNLSPQGWAMVALGVMLVEWGFVTVTQPQAATGEKESVNSQTSSSHHLQDIRETTPQEYRNTSRSENRYRKMLRIWQQSAWFFGLLLAGISYLLLFETIYPDFVEYSAWGLAWSTAPVALTAMASGNILGRQQVSGWLSVLGLGALQFLTFGWNALSLFSLGIAAIVMLVNTRILRQTTAAAMTLGFGLCFAGMVVREGILGLPPLSLEGWLLFGAISCASLWLLSSVLFRQGAPLALLYGDAAEGWATALCSLGFPLLTVRSLLVFWGYVEPSVSIVIAIALVFGGTLVRCWSSPSNWGIYCLGWGLELLTVEVLGFVGISRISLAIANVTWGLLTQLLGDGWQRQTRKPLPSGWHVVPVFYGVLATLLRSNIVTRWTGLTTLAFALIALGVGRRQPGLKPWVYLGFVGVSAAAYELLWYQIGDLAAGDQLIALAAMGTTILYVYRLFTPWLSPYLGLSADELKIPAHWHWAASSMALTAAVFNPVHEQSWLGLGTGLFLTRYALMQGRYRQREDDLWVYLGLLEAAGLTIFIVDLLQFDDILLPWAGAISAVIAYFLFILPWESWGWHPDPWKNSALIIPTATIVCGTVWGETITNTTSLAIVAIFYALLAVIEQRIRLTYFSVFFLNWLGIQEFIQLQFSHSLWYIAPPLFSILYLAQVDPELKQGDTSGESLRDRRSLRHLIRIVASGCLNLVAFVTASWLVSGIYSLLFLFSGIGLRIRAFLYIGTISFLANAFNQLVLLSQTHSFVKWLIGLIVGILFIWIAASFETRREQIKKLFKNLMVELENWQ
jgi:hypothetical protein